jgi:hypothetical protein
MRLHNLPQASCLDSATQTTWQWHKDAVFGTHTAVDTFESQPFVAGTTLVVPETSGGIAGFVFCPTYSMGNFCFHLSPAETPRKPQSHAMLRHSL